MNDDECGTEMEW